jgi:NADH-quinone oxidoreductase subunit M
VLLVVPPAKEAAIKATGTVFAGLALIAAAIVALRFDYGENGLLQQVVNLEWIPQIDVNYHIGVDGMSLPLVVLSALVSFLCMIYLYFHVPDPGKPKALFALVLLLETGMTGTFVALDLILFFIFFEIVLVPMYFMIGIWGGPNREYAAVKFFLFTLFGSIFKIGRSHV